LKIAIVGHGRAGKDEAAAYFHEHTRCRYALSTSEVIAPVAAARLGLPVAEAFARRHEDRATWRAIGDEMRANDPAALARETLRHGDICVGIRAIVEIEAVRREGLVGLIIWIDRDVPPDPTLEFGSEQADIVIENRWDLPAFHARLRRLANAMGVLRTT
jgi:hypothetical protein